MVLQVRVSIHLDARMRWSRAVAPAVALGCLEPYKRKVLVDPVASSPAALVDAAIATRTS
jgi:hypothetical protein